MNAFFDKNEYYSSNKGILEAYLGECVPSPNKLKKVLGGMRIFWNTLCAALLSKKVLCVLKALGMAISLVGFVGIIGAMEHGKLQLGTGLFIGALLLAVEILCLRPHTRQD